MVLTVRARKEQYYAEKLLLYDQVREARSHSHRLNINQIRLQLRSRAVDSQHGFDEATVLGFLSDVDVRA